MVKQYRVVLLFVACACAVLPARARAQTASGIIAGAVRDSTGAVLPGVTVEAASPALIEKLRAVSTDSQGNYRIEALRPGTYTVTFTLSGFRTFKREALELNTGVTATSNAVMELGSLEETVTVSGASSIVDVQNVRQQAVFTKEVQEALPLGRQVAQWVAVMPQAVLSANNQDVGGVQSKATFIGVHGVSGAGGSMGMFHDGINFMSSGTSHGYMVNSAAIQESVLETGGFAAENIHGTVQLNLIPRDGGNSFSLTSSGSYMPSQGSNLTDELKARGAIKGGALRYNRTANVGAGGPILRDRLWFYVAGQRSGSSVTSPGVYFNSDVKAWVYQPDRSRESFTVQIEQDRQLRFTWAVTEKNKINVNWVGSVNCQCQFGAQATSPEASNLIDQHSPLYLATWTYPRTSRLLFEAGGGLLHHLSDKTPQYHLGVTKDAISVLDQATGISYRSSATAFGLTSAWGPDRLYQDNERFSMSYITGSHSLKLGFQVLDGNYGDATEIPGDVVYRVNNGVANRVTVFASPSDTIVRSLELGLYAQDQWTLRRFTLNLGARLDTFRGWVPEQTQAAGRWVPERHYDRIDNVPNWKDVTGRFGAAYDLFGDGKTALKGSLGKYLGWANAMTHVLNRNPVYTQATSATRNWTDANRDWIAQDNELGPLSNVNFGKQVVSTFYNTDLDGWGAREFNWQAGAQIQHELTRRMGLNVGYFRTWYGNFTATDNRAVTPADFSPFCIAAPKDARLPGGGGQQICGLYDVSSAKFGQVDNLVRQASTFGTRTQVFNGVDATLNWRFGKGGNVTGGISTGRTILDSCAQIVDSPDKRFCRDVQPWSAGTNLKFGVITPLPWDIRLSGTFQNLSGVPITAIYTASNAEVAPSLGRNLGSCLGAAVCTGTVAVPLLGPKELYEPRLTQVDVRLTRLVRIRRARFQLNADVFNLFNGSAVRTMTTAYGPQWRRPTDVMGARMLKIGFQVDM